MAWEFFKIIIVADENQEPAPEFPNSDKPSTPIIQDKIWIQSEDNWFGEGEYGGFGLSVAGGGRYKETLICINDKGQLYYGDI